MAQGFQRQYESCRRNTEGSFGTPGGGVPKQPPVKGDGDTLGPPGTLGTSLYIIRLVVVVERIHVPGGVQGLAKWPGALVHPWAPVAADTSYGVECCKSLHSASRTVVIRNSRVHCFAAVLW